MNACAVVRFCRGTTWLPSKAAGEKEASSGYWQLKQCKYTCKFIEKVIFTVRKQLKLFLYDCSIFFSLGRLSQPSTEPSLLGPLASPLLLRRLTWQGKNLLHEEISLVFQAIFRRFSGHFGFCKSFERFCKIFEDLDLGTILHILFLHIFS